MDSFQVYRDMKARTNGEIYIGVVGPVRTGKSTFIKRFMDLLVLPNMTDEHARERTQDELPQSASGTTIMTTEPKFVPKEAAAVKISDDVEVKIRLIDCVGYMVEGASGHTENDAERQVKTPWFEYEIPFTKAAAIGTQKVIHDHATIGFVVTTDGSVTGLPRENYIPAEEKTVKELQSIGKPFIILLNCRKPYSEEAKALKEELEGAEEKEVPVIMVRIVHLQHFLERFLARSNFEIRLHIEDGLIPENTGYWEIRGQEGQTLSVRKTKASKEAETVSPGELVTVLFGYRSERKEEREVYENMGPQMRVLLKGTQPAPPVFLNEIV